MGYCDRTIGIAIHCLLDDNTNTTIKDSIYFHFFELPSDLERILWDLILQIQDVIFNLKRHAFLSGCYKAFGFGAYPCSLCETCLPEEGDVDFHTAKRLCRHQDQLRLRPSMETSGIDVYATVRAAGFELNVVRLFDETIKTFGIVLLR